VAERETGPVEAREAGAAEAPVLVCGLGSLGQACLQRLLSFNVPLACVDLEPPRWRDPSLEQRLRSCLTLGDMRLAHVLRQAGAPGARAVLLLSSESTVNLEAALQVRLLNPRADIVVRAGSRQADLGALLEERLPGVAVVDPVLLCAEAISSALRPETIPVSFEAHGQDFQILAQPWDDHRFQRPLRMPLNQPGGEPLLVMPRSLSQGSDVPVATHRRRRRWQRLPARAAAALGQATRPQKLILLALVLLAALGVRFFSALGGWQQGLFVTLALLKGEYVDPVNVLLGAGHGLQQVSGWLIGGTLVYSLVGTLLTSALVAAILERLLRDRLGTSRSRLPRRARRPVLLLGSGSLAERVARLQERLGRTVLLVGSEPTAAAGVIRFDDLPAALQALDGLPARAVGLLSTDLLANLQVALSLQQRWPDARIAMLTHAFGAAEQLGDLLGGVAVISAMDLVADAMVATAFGERIGAVLRLRGTNLLQVLYRVEPDDTLCGRSVARLENGYGITVVSLWRPRRGSALSLPKLDTVVAPDDQLVVLATADSLRRIELGEASPPGCRLRLQNTHIDSAGSRFDAQQLLARALGCLPGEVAGLLDGREHLSPPLDDDLCALLIAELRRQGVRCQVERACG
jgi:Trk K+ transport system NAD-binding subunit